MSIQLNPEEVRKAHELIKAADKPEMSGMEAAIATLEKHNGDLETSFQDLWQAEVGDLGTPETGGKSLWQVTLKVLSF